ncbi:hypothetical protein D3P07_10500 [Paenibacillus sp. 1011MAR3C5]|uniref:hypothetical protein n=1 Tax=Paenibacillus sp. 1011MAR3C5 TaxID=1675787 RepID=UPI000E6D38B1|nr:hypothetical protein [Paenibacillus sp. 1011MAR3C5]RJE88425.1 hypothetical protein D3P07_10500 [Paenibacillus sp. 1011MAR3C5]
MRSFRVPPFLHEVFGERQSPGSVLAILMGGGLLTAALAWTSPELTGPAVLWRTVLALLLIFDIFAGCIANFTASTSNYYAVRSAKRLIFISVHLHLPAIAWLLQTDTPLSVGVWAYTICGAFLVNAQVGKPSQPWIAGVLLSLGIGLISLLPFDTSYMRMISLLFMVKVLFAFSVDHYGRASGHGLQE